jgi:hypothetical protein
MNSAMQQSIIESGKAIINAGFSANVRSRKDKDHAKKD